MRPRIGITSSGTPGRKYVESVQRAGGEPVALRNDANSLEEQLGKVDGLVLSGGPDVDPARYGASVLRPETKCAAPARDAFEIVAARYARERGLPVLCVCRGLQVANVAFGGTLVQDLLAERALAGHQQTEYGFERGAYAREHRVRVASESALARLLGTTEFATNSMHHQAADRVAEGLVIVARSPDGTIEALDAGFEHPFFFAVQWHPEELNDDVSARLFSGLVRASERGSDVR